MKKAALVIFQPEYYQLKRNVINECYEVTNYVSLLNDIEEFEGHKTLSLEDIPGLHGYDVVVIAMPLDPVVKKTVQLLSFYGISIQNIEFLYDKPDYLPQEYLARLDPNLYYSLQEDGEVICHVAGDRFILTTSSDQFYLYEIYGTRSYDMLLPYENVVVVDIGMNIGLSVVRLAGLKGVKKVYAYEPFAETYAYALKNIALNQKEHMVEANLYGLGKTNREMAITYDFMAKGSMKTYENHVDTENAATGTKEKIAIRDISQVFGDLLQKHPREKCMFKIDCEGSEYEILERLDQTGQIKHIASIAMEWHNIEGKSVDFIEKILFKNGFAYYYPSFDVDETGSLVAFKVK